MECSAGLLDLVADVDVTGDRSALHEPGGDEHLNAVTDREDAFAGGIELAHDFEHPKVVAEVFGRASAENQHGLVVPHVHIGECQMGLDAVSRAFDVGVPAGLEIVHHQVQAALAGSGYDGPVAGFEEAMIGVEGFVAFTRIAREDEDSWRSSRFHDVCSSAGNRLQVPAPPALGGPVHWAGRAAIVSAA